LELNVLGVKSLRLFAERILDVIFHISVLLLFPVLLAR